MIKTNELRPGNRVQYARPMRMENLDGSDPGPFGTLYGIVESVKIFRSIIIPGPPLEEIMLEGFMGVTHPDMLAGIPLTSEWLEKFGFSYKDGADAFGTYRKNFCHIYKHDDEEGYFHFSLGTFHGKKLEITSVHQLQNLYFGVIGEELMVNI